MFKLLHNIALNESILSMSAPGETLFRRVLPIRSASYPRRQPAFGWIMTHLLEYIGVPAG